MQIKIFFKFLLRKRWLYTLAKSSTSESKRNSFVSHFIASGFPFAHISSGRDVSANTFLDKLSKILQLFYRLVHSVFQACDTIFSFKRCYFLFSSQDAKNDTLIEYDILSLFKDHYKLVVIFIDENKNMNMAISLNFFPQLFSINIFSIILCFFFCIHIFIYIL